MATARTASAHLAAGHLAAMGLASRGHDGSKQVRIERLEIDLAAGIGCCPVPWRSAPIHNLCLGKGSPSMVGEQVMTVEHGTLQSSTKGDARFDPACKIPKARCEEHTWHSL